MHRWSSFWPASVAFGYPNFRLFLSARFLLIASTEMQAVAVAWQVYGLTHRPLDLGLVGLAQFLPGLLLFLAAGHAADRFPRERIVIACAGAWSLSSLLLAGLTLHGLRSVFPIYLVLVLNGVIRAFNGPAGQALLPQVIPVEHFQNAIAWHASVFQMATILGPMLGGLLYAVAGSPVPVYCGAAVAYLAGMLNTWAIRIPRAERRPVGASLEMILAGLRYIWRSKLVLGATLLDLFAVLLGGAVALLPVYARDILKVGASGLGLLRSAPSLGAVIMAIVVAHWPLRRRAGAKMLACVFGFGLFTVVFGLSRNLALSLAALVLLGALDMVSVIVRQTMVQLATPDEMRGRVSAVNGVFIGASNEMGQFESGITAQWFGTVPAVVLGGIGTMIIVLIWLRLFPSLRRVQDLAAPPLVPPAS
jgi:MFS family permease